MTVKRVPMTAEGAKHLHTELDRLEHVSRPEVIKAIAEARAHGDLKENAEYHEAKKEQSLIEGRIHHIKHKLAHAQVIDVTKIKNEGAVVFGATVELVNIDTDDKVIYKIVGEDEANIKEKKISINSPIARALIGKCVGDEVEVQTPSGATSFEVVGVEYV
jgi:transcription elongation factor GreA